MIPLGSKYYPQGGPTRPRALPGPGDFQSRTAPTRAYGRLINDPSLISLAFGAGKRICPGRHFVDATLFILASSVLAVFDVSKPRSKSVEGEDCGNGGEDEIETGIIW